MSLLAKRGNLCMVPTSALAEIATSLTLLAMTGRESEDCLVMVLLAMTGYY